MEIRKGIIIKEEIDLKWEDGYNRKRNGKEI